MKLLTTTLLWAVIATAVRAQDEATTLGGLTDRARDVVLVRALRSEDPDPTTHRWRFAVEQSLRGGRTGTFVLDEPAGRACGRMLHGILPGQRFVAFLRDAPAGPVAAAGGARSLPRADPRLVAHVRALVDAGPGGRRAVLVAGLAGGHDRVRRDAALDLAGRTDLDGLDAGDRQVVLDGLRAAVAGRDRALTALTTVSARAGIDGALDVLVPVYLEGDRRLDGLLLSALPRFDGAAVEARLLAARLRPGAAQMRAARLARRLEGAGNTILDRLLRSPHRGTARLAATGLLARGVPERALRGIVPESVLGVARRRARRPAFRSVLQGSSR